MGINSKNYLFFQGYKIIGYNIGVKTYNNAYCFIIRTFDFVLIACILNTTKLNPACFNAKICMKTKHFTTPITTIIARFNFTSLNVYTKYADKIGKKNIFFINNQQNVLPILNFTAHMQFMLNVK